MEARKYETVVQMDPPVVTDFVKQVLYSAYEKESQLKETITNDEKEALDYRRLDLFPCSLDLN